MGILRRGRSGPPIYTQEFLPRVPYERPDGELPRVAALTMTRDEGAMIGHWVAHYGAQFGVENLYVVDDHSTDGSTDALGCTVLRPPYLDKYPFERSRIGMLNSLSAALLHAYDAVVFADADEFLVAEPRRFAGLREFIATTADRDVIGALGFNVVQHVENEGPLSFDRPLLQQRRYAKFMPLMCKPMLKWAPVPWVRASHGVQTPFRVDPDLFMFHFKFADRDQLATRATLRKQLHDDEGRAEGSSWSRDADTMGELFDQISVDIVNARAAGADDASGRFRPAQDRIDQIIQPRDGAWKAVGPGQFSGMRSQPVVRIPDRFVRTV